MHFSNGDQGQDHSGRFEIEFHHVVHDKFGIAVNLGSGHGEQGVDTPYKGGHGAESYQGIHVRRAVPQTPEATDEKFLIDDHDDSCKKQLYKSHGDMVAIKPGWQRPSPHHVSHGKVHQHQKKTY